MISSFRRPSPFFAESRSLSGQISGQDLVQVWHGVGRIGEFVAPYGITQVVRSVVRGRRTRAATNTRPTWVASRSVGALAL
jgi:hypothetical protein